MRLLLDLVAAKDCSYDLMYYHKLQGFIYNFLKDTKFSGLHDKIGYKFFCFSNIFSKNKQGKDFIEGEKKNLIISSPNKEFVMLIKEKLDGLNGQNMGIGEMLFELENTRIISPKLVDRGFTVETSTPIIIRIPKERYGRYGIANEKKWLYWRPEYAFNAFVKQLEENLFKKYSEFFGEKLDEFPLFEQYHYICPVVNHVVVDGFERQFVGSIWKFIFSYASKEQRKILEFGLDCGFGERNSLGFGFVNVLKSVNTQVTESI